MLKSFEDSDFCVTFTGECPDSRVIRGWSNVLDYINKEVHEGLDYSCRSPCCELHDADNWSDLGQVYQTPDGDQRHKFSNGEYAYCVGLHIVRLTMPIEETLIVSEQP